MTKLYYRSGTMRPDRVSWYGVVFNNKSEALKKARQMSRCFGGERMVWRWEQRFGKACPVMMSLIEEV